MRVYAFSNTIVLLNGVEVTGWAEGDDVIGVKRLTDAASHKIGAGGSMVVSLSSDKSGEFTLKLQQTSSTNQYLNQLSQFQEGGAATFLPITVRFQDLFRQDMANGTVGYLKKHTDMNRGEKANDQTWVIIVERIDLVLGNMPDAVPNIAL